MAGVRPRTSKTFMPQERCPLRTSDAEEPIVVPFEIAKYWILQGHPYRQIGDAFVFSAELRRRNLRKPLENPNACICDGRRRHSNQCRRRRGNANGR